MQKIFNGSSLMQGKVVINLLACKVNTVLQNQWGCNSKTMDGWPDL